MTKPELSFLRAYQLTSRLSQLENLPSAPTLPPIIEETIQETEPTNSLAACQCHSNCLSAFDPKMACCNNPDRNDLTLILAAAHAAIERRRLIQKQ